MAYALRTGAGPVELAYGQTVTAGDVSFSYESMVAWSDGERADHGISAIVEPGPVPDGKVVIGSSLQADNGTIRRVWTLEDASDVPAPVPASISRRQFFRALAGRSLITEGEALAAMAGTIPPEMLAIIGALPEPDQFDAKMLVAGASVFERANPLVSAFMAAEAMTANQVDDLWREGGSL